MESIRKMILENSFSTAEIADALNKNGVIPLCYPVATGLFGLRVGRVRPVFVANGSNYHLHNEIKNVLPNEVVVIFTENCEGRAVIGEIVTRYLIDKKMATAVVVHGLVRDQDSLVERALPVWCMGRTPIGCHNAPAPAFSSEDANSKCQRYNNGLAVCDDEGVVVIPKKIIDSNFESMLTRIRFQEKVWEYCLESLGWDTKRIICDKEYLRDMPSETPAEIIDAIRFISETS